jgi:hypothetical protein
MTKFDILAEQFLLELQYTDIAHAPGDRIWLWDGNKIISHISKGTIMDNHGKLFPDIDPEQFWHGRTSVYGKVIVIPPIKDYVKSRMDIPIDVRKSIVKTFKPETIYIAVPYKGLVKAA